MRDMVVKGQGWRLGQVQGQDTDLHECTLGSSQDVFWDGEGTGFQQLNPCVGCDSEERQRQLQGFNSNCRTQNKTR